MSTVAVCLKDTMWTLDIHTHTVIYMDISFSLFQALNLLPPVLLSPQCFHYCWVFVVSAALGGNQITGAPKIKTVTTAEDSTVEFALWDGGVCVEGRGAYQLAGCAHLVFLSLTFGPQQVFGKLPTPTTSNVGASVTATLLYSFSLFTHHHHHHLPVHLTVLQTHTNLLSIVHRYCFFFFLNFCFFLLC